MAAITPAFGAMPTVIRAFRALITVHNRQSALTSKNRDFSPERVRKNDFPSIG